MTAYYKVVAINGMRESNYTTTKNVCVGLYKENFDTKDFDYNLKQNYPNPFNPKTQICFSLKENSFVSLKVFDVLGKEIIVLVNQVLNAGNHQVEFDGNNFDSGIYFYEIKTSNFRDIKKLILVK